MLILGFAPVRQRVFCGVLVAFALMALPTFVEAQEEEAEAEPEAQTEATSETPAPVSPAKPISVGLLVGYGTDLGEDANPWGFGLGVRAGYNLKQIYLGARFAYHFGSSYETTFADESVNLWELSFEAGYDLAVADRLTVRPSLGLGLVNLIVNVDDSIGISGSASATDTKLVFAPGASIFYDITPDIFLGAELRLPFVLGGDSIFGFVVYANGGMRF